MFFPTIIELLMHLVVISYIIFKLCGLKMIKVFFKEVGQLYIGYYINHISPYNIQIGFC